jgi:hypothetical protein
MLSINLDLDFFTHPKVIRFAGLLGSGSEIHLIRLWCFVGKHSPGTGGLDDWSAEEVESAADWRGEKGGMIEAMLRCKLIHRRKKGFSIHDWAEHAAHLQQYEKVRSERRKAAKKRWEGKGGEARLPGKPEAGSAGRPRAVWDGSGYVAPPLLLSLWEKAYPGVDISRELARAAAWTAANPRRAPRRDCTRFLNAWLGRAAADAAPAAYSLDPALIEWAEDGERRGVL